MAVVPQINRSVVSIGFKKPFADWVAHVFSETDMKQEDYDPDLVAPNLEQLNSHPTSYLTAAVIDFDDEDAYANEYWQFFFEAELTLWDPDQEHWPKKRTREVFDEWFEMRFSHEVIDLSFKEPLGYLNDDD